MINVGIIGCGSISKQRHSYEYFHNKDVKIIGFFDMYPERAKELSGLFGGKVYENVDDLINDPQIDAVSVCVAMLILCTLQHHILITMNTLKCALIIIKMFFAKSQWLLRLKIAKKWLTRL